MGLGVAVVKLILELRAREYFKETHSVIEMGRQGIHIRPTEFQQILKAAGFSGHRQENSFKLQDGCDDFYPSRPFYEMLGIKKYSYIDIRPQDGAIAHDLNCPLEDKSLYGQYDLVTDYGYNECVFNTCEAYRTMHNLCKEGGLLFISQNIYRGKGLYAYDPSFLEGVASANNYRILFSSFIITTKMLANPSDSYQYHVPLSWALIDTFDLMKIGGLDLFYVMQKQSATDFHLSYQGSFFSSNQTHHGYRLNYSQNPPGRTYIPAHTLADIPDRALWQDLRRRLYSKFKG